MSIPPKDYTNTESSALDVNMNNGERTVRECDEISSADDVPQIKGHKKLERLSKQGPKPVIGPKPVLGLKGEAQRYISFVCIQSIVCFQMLIAQE